MLIEDSTPELKRPPLSDACFNVDQQESPEGDCIEEWALVNEYCFKPENLFKDDCYYLDQEVEKGFIMKYPDTVDASCNVVPEEQSDACKEAWKKAKEQCGDVDHYRIG